MPNADQWTQAVKKLIQLTEDGKLDWTPHQFPATLKENVIGNIFCASVDGRWIVVYEYQYQCFTDEETWHWDNEIAIEFVEGTGKLQWKWPTVQYRFQLLDAIRAKVCGADVFLKHFLKD